MCVSVSLINRVGYLVAGHDNQAEAFDSQLSRSVTRYVSYKMRIFYGAHNNYMLIPRIIVTGSSWCRGTVIQTKRELDSTSEEKQLAIQHIRQVRMKKGKVQIVLS